MIEKDEKKLNISETEIDEAVENAMKVEEEEGFHINIGCTG